MDVSIIIPVYNVSRYIQRCIKSIMSQDFGGTLECIIVNDCSQDDSIEKCEKLIEKYRGPITFKILHHTCNKGLSAARNTGTKEAKGVYIYYVDSDDDISSDAIRILYAMTKKYADVDIVMGNTTFNKAVNNYDISEYAQIEYTENIDWLCVHFFKSGLTIPANAWNKLIRRQFLITNKLEFMYGIIHEDDQWMFHVLKYLKSFCFVKSYTYHHYATVNSIMTTLTKEKEAVNWQKILLDFSNNYYKPFICLQLLQSMSLYFGQNMYEFHLSLSRKLHYNFLKYSIKERLWKLSIILFLWNLIYPFRDGTNLKIRLKRMSCDLYARESKRLIKKYPIKLNQ